MMYTISQIIEYLDFIRVLSSCSFWCVCVYSVCRCSGLVQKNGFAQKVVVDGTIALQKWCWHTLLLNLSEQDQNLPATDVTLRSPMICPLFREG